MYVATPALVLTNTDALSPGTLLTFGGAGLEGQDTSVCPLRLFQLMKKGMFCNMIIGGAVEALSFPIAECRVPDGLDGPGEYLLRYSGLKLTISPCVYCQLGNPALCQYYHARCQCHRCR